MRIDSDLTGTSSVAIDSSGHFLPSDKCLYFLLGGDKFSALGSLQGISDELRILVYFRAQKEIFYSGMGKEEAQCPVTCF